jgi:hypothetical protein
MVLPGDSHQDKVLNESRNFHHYLKKDVKNSEKWININSIGNFGIDTSFDNRV